MGRTVSDRKVPFFGVGSPSRLVRSALTACVRLRSAERTIMSVPCAASCAIVLRDVRVRCAVNAPQSMCSMRNWVLATRVSSLYLNAGKKRTPLRDSYAVRRRKPKNNAEANRTLMSWFMGIASREMSWSASGSLARREACEFGYFHPLAELLRGFGGDVALV